MMYCSEGETPKNHRHNSHAPTRDAYIVGMQEQGGAQGRPAAQLE